MKICRYDNDRLGIVIGDMVHDVTAAQVIRPVFFHEVPRWMGADKIRLQLAAVVAQGAADDLFDLAVV